MKAALQRVRPLVPSVVRSVAEVGNARVPGVVVHHSHHQSLLLTLARDFGSFCLAKSGKLQVVCPWSSSVGKVSPEF